MAIALARAGHDFTLIERSPALGGALHDNIYPGAGCHVPSHLYCFSFAPNDWQRKFALQPEIHRYFTRLADEHDLASRVRFNTEVHSARYADGAWQLRTSSGDVTADAIVSGCGQ